MFKFLLLKLELDIWLYFWFIITFELVFNYIQFWILLFFLVCLSISTSAIKTFRSGLYFWKPVCKQWFLMLLMCHRRFCPYYCYIARECACVGSWDFYSPTCAVSRGCFHSCPGRFYPCICVRLHLCRALVYCCMPSLILLPLERRKYSDIWKRLVGKAISDHSVPADHTQLTGGARLWHYLNR